MKSAKLTPHKVSAQIPKSVKKQHLKPAAQDSANVIRVENYPKVMFRMHPDCYALSQGVVKTKGYGGVASIAKVAMMDFLLAEGYITKEQRLAWG